MYIARGKKNAKNIKANTRPARRRRVMADAEVSPEATDLLFEAEDVADLIAEVTGEDVMVEATEDAVEFQVGEEDVYTIEPEGDEEVLEASTRIVRKRPVKASTKRAVRRRK